ncbi:MAG TPA: DUF1501 domain-containing protein [Thermoanaerobaculia bacterium]|nr:DUF1501 domain-containing protein [Thermoanaerobaculia bacterium]
MPFSRRSFLTSLGALSLPAWFPRLAFGAKPEERAAARDVLVCVFQRGGADGLNVVVPHAESAYHDARPTLKIPDPGATNGAIDLDGFFGLHPSLAPFKELYDDGALAVVHAVGSPDANHSHFASMDVVERGTPSNQVTSGWIGRHLASLQNGNTSPFRAVGFSSLLQASLRGPVSATALASIVDFHLKGRHGMTAAQVTQFQTTLASLYNGATFTDLQGGQTFKALTQLAQANPGQYQPDNGAQYPTSDFGKGLLQVAQVIKADLGLEVACVDLGGWDTHSAEGVTTGQLPGLLDDLSTSLHAFATDMGSRMNGITVVTMSEFGRRLKENASGGTDHGSGSCMFVLGGGVNGGKVYANWPGLAPAQLFGPGDLAPTTDFRTVLGEVVAKRLGNSALDSVFPGFTEPAFLGVCK